MCGTRIALSPFVMGGRGRVLLVDDDAEAREMLGEYLGDEGFTVATAEDGISAARKLDLFAPDIVLTDLEMPAMDGLELIRLLHDMEPRLPTVLMTARADRAARHIPDAHPSACLLKPLDLDELTMLLDRLVERAGGAHDAATHAAAR